MIFGFWVMMKILQGGLSEILWKFRITISKSTKTYGLSPNFKACVLWVQLRCLRVFNLCCDESNLVWHEYLWLMNYYLNVYVDEYDVTWCCS